MRALTIAATITMLCMGWVFAQVVPPINLEADLLPGGEVLLTWEPPPDGIFEDFNDGEAQGFGLYPDMATWEFTNGMLYANANATFWQDGVYEDQQFTDFTCEVWTQNGNDTSMRGIMFRGDGPRGSGTFNGYAFYVSLALEEYGVFYYVNGGFTQIVPWTAHPSIQTEIGGVNVFKVVGSGSTFDFYINDEYVDQVTNALYAEGYCGFLASNTSQVYFDDFSCNHGATPSPQLSEFSPGQRDPIARDDLGNPIPGADPIAPEVPIPEYRIENTLQPSRELDEFIEYRVYRDGTFLGPSDVELYSDFLPALGDYSYTVTALYDEGESSAAGPVIVSWEPVIFSLTGQTTTIPPGGGTLLYGVSLQSMIGITVPGVRYWTMVQLPNTQMFGPLFMYPFTLTPFMDVTVTNLTQDVPAMAPTGIYTFYGHLGFYPNSGVSDSFEFEKTGTVSDGAFVYDPDQWEASGSLVASEESRPEALPSDISMSDAWPNPFNPATSLTITLPSAAELKVVVYNTAGQRVATLTDGMHTAGTHTLTFTGEQFASGMYLIQARADGYGTITKKALLMK